MTDKYAYCSTVPRTFVHDCSLPQAKRVRRWSCLVKCDRGRVSLLKLAEAV